MHPRHRQLGATLIEIMIAMTIGLVILAGTISLFVHSHHAFNDLRRVNQLTESGRYAASLLADDLRNAGYLAEFNPSSLPTPASPDPCATDIASLVGAMAMPIQGYNNAAVVPGCVSDVKAGTDIVVIRRASTCALDEPGCDPFVSGAPYFQASGCNNSTELGSGDVRTYFVLDTATTQLSKTRIDCSTLAPIHQYRVHIYFVANNNSAGDGIPTLKRAELGPNGFTIVPLIDGVENLQMEYGVDSATPSTGTPAFYTADPGSDQAWRNVVSAKIHLLSRSTTPTAGYTDSNTYYLGADTVFSPAGAAAPFKRHVYETTVRINNTAGRNLP